MKKFLAMFLVFVLLLSGCAPKVSEEPDSSGSESSVPEGSKEFEQPEKPEVTVGEMQFLRDNFPRIDGSTSLIPLEAGIRAAIFGKSMEEATKDVAHTTTWGAFNRMFEGEVDIDLSCPISHSQTWIADNAGFEYELVPIAMEGFVFVVNAKNTVDTLTQEQLRKIYSGEITNWKEVGGNDAEIIAYQRNRDSGSQNFMIDFMGETELMDAPSYMRPGSMSGLMDVVAVNDNAENSIGYSVYAYAADMYGNGDEIKFIKVDGVAPSKAAMASREYPLTSYNYAIFDKNLSGESAVRRLVNWMISDEGQLAIAKAGYATIRDIGFDYSEPVIEKYDAVGCGMKLPEEKLPSYEYKALSANKVGSDIIEKLADEKLKGEINAFIDEALKEVSKERENYNIYVEPKTEMSYVTGFPYLFGGAEEPENVVVSAKNGYLSVAVTLGYMMDANNTYDFYYRTETATWDLITGKRLAPEELFYEGVNIDEALNAYLKVKSAKKLDPFYAYEMKADFAGIPKEGWSITHDAIYFDWGGPYFEDGVRISFDELPEGIMVTERPQDMSECFNDKNFVSKEFRIIENSKIYKYLQDSPENYVDAAVLADDSYPTAKKINAAAEEYILKYFGEETVIKYFEAAGVDREKFMDSGALMGAGWRLTDYGGKYVEFSGSEIWYDKYNGSSTPTEYRYPYGTELFFDLRTGERLDWRDMLTGSWRKDLELVNNDLEQGIAYKDYSKLSLVLFYRAKESYSIILSDESGAEYILKVPDEYIDW